MELDLTKIHGRRVLVSDLLDADLLTSGEELIWERPRLGVTYRATVLANGSIQLEGGGRFSSPSRAAMEAADIPACDGWYCWRARGTFLHDLRADLVQRVGAEDGRQAESLDAALRPSA